MWGAVCAGLPATAMAVDDSLAVDTGDVHQARVRPTVQHIAHTPQREARHARRVKDVAKRRRQGIARGLRGGLS